MPGVRVCVEASGRKLGLEERLRDGMRPIERDDI
jgi:hypothetical protein